MNYNVATKNIIIIELARGADGASYATTDMVKLARTVSMLNIRGLGNLPANIHIPVMEENGKIIPFGQWPEEQRRQYKATELRVNAEILSGLTQGGYTQAQRNFCAETVRALEQHLPKGSIATLTT
jgi:hypothetical protein